MDENITEKELDKYNENEDFINYITNLPLQTLTDDLKQDILCMFQECRYDK